MPDHLESVKEVARNYRSWAPQQTDAARRLAIIETANQLDAAAAEIVRLRASVAPLPTRLGDLSDIPQELRSELSGIELDELEGQLVAVINSYEGKTADLNQILVGLFRKFKVVQKRRLIQQRLWRMQGDGLAWAVPKKKGVYTTVKPETPEEEDFGDFGSPGPTKRTVHPSKPEDDDEIPF
jgi:hypothetical protein